MILLQKAQSGHSNFPREKNIFGHLLGGPRVETPNQFGNQPIRKLAFISYESYVQKLQVDIITRSDRWSFQLGNGNVCHFEN